MSNKEMQAIIEEYIKSHPGTSFIEIERLFEENDFDFRGDIGIFPSTEQRKGDAFIGKNILFWAGWNHQACDIFCEIIAGDFHYETCPLLLYIADGGFLDIPIAKKHNHDYKDIHWLPAVISADKKVFKEE